MEITSLKTLYKNHCGYEPDNIEELPSSGSNRRYFRISGDGGTFIGVLGNNLQENEAFLDFDRQFTEKGLPVPVVLAVSPDRMSYLQTDLGDTLLFNAIEKGRITHVFSPMEKQLLEETMRRLPDFQFAASNGQFDFSKCFPAKEFDRRSIMWDLNYFKYCFLKATGIEFEENLLEDDFNRLADTLLEADCDSFMYRDFQSRNVMIHNGEPWFIDFQGGRKGPCQYDVASFLWQAKANFSPDLRRELIDVYIQSARRYHDIDKAHFMDTLRQFVLFRTIQVLGAYGFRGYFEKKPHFMQSVPFAIANLRALLAEKPFYEYPYLQELLQRLVDLKQFTSEIEKRQLTVRVLSFAYKKGIP
ncbi:MAG: phosphotransferase [Muribaculaceae bacterium]|nr:phosphotransferase [Muribaculaceae bacterium]